MNLKDLGIRRLGGLDIVREGDIQWDENGIISPRMLTAVIVEKGDWCVGLQIQSEELSNYTNRFYRKLNAPSY